MDFKLHESNKCKCNRAHPKKSAYVIAEVAAKAQEPKRAQVECDSLNKTARTDHEAATFLSS